MVNSMPLSVAPVARVPWESPPRASDLPSSRSALVTRTPPRITSSAQGSPLMSATSPSEEILTVFDQLEGR